MPRNKSTKRTKRQISNLTLANLQKIEKDLYSTPVKLANQFNKEINVHKKQEIKLTKIVNKYKGAIKTADARTKQAAEKNSPAAKSQFKKFKKIYADALKQHDNADKERQKVITLLENLQSKQAKLIAIHKHLNQFEKEWSKNTKKTKTPANQSAKKRPAKINSEEKPAEKTDVFADNHITAETTELAS